MTEISEATLLRSRLFAEIIANRADEALRKIIEQYGEPLDFTPIETLMISSNAWSHVLGLDVSPQLIFAHPDVLQSHPETSAYYRGIALLSRKRVRQETKADVKKWEIGEQKSDISYSKALAVARLYNAMTSSIIEGKSNWTLENGYRNILATMGITLDGSFRNTIGEMAEDLIKNRIVSWLVAQQAIVHEDPDNGLYHLPNNTIMRFGSEPDISFERSERLIATIEVKGGTDRAGALERLGAMKKSFDETPAGCINFLVSGVITDAMSTRIDEIGTVKPYRLGDLASDGAEWDDFTREVFHHAVRII